MRNGVPLVVSRRRKVEESISDADCRGAFTVAHFRAATLNLRISGMREFYLPSFNSCGERNGRMYS